ncbi:hypothetical protein CBL_11453 [Carabus blaptoides fortunei]
MGATSATRARSYSRPTSGVQLTIWTRGRPVLRGETRLIDSKAGAIVARHVVPHLRSSAAINAQNGNLTGKHALIIGTIRCQTHVWLNGRESIAVTLYQRASAANVDITINMLCAKRTVVEDAPDYADNHAYHCSGVRLDTHKCGFREVHCVRQQELYEVKLSEIRLADYGHRLDVVAGCIVEQPYRVPYACSTPSRNLTEVST